MSKETRPQRNLNTHWDVVLESPNVFGPGCSFECIYCNQQAADKDADGNRTTPYITTTIDSGISLNDKVFSGPKLVMRKDHSEMIQELKTFPYYDQNQALIVRNFSEPALNWAESFDLAQRAVDELGHQGLIVFITKGKMNKKESLRAGEMVRAGIKLIFVVTYSGSPINIERAPKQGRIETAISLSDENVPIIHSMRPMIEGVNTDPVIIESVLREISPYITVATVGGLFVYDFTISQFQKAGIELSDFYRRSDPYLEKKLLPDYIPPLIRQIAHRDGITYPFYNHTSCAIAYVARSHYQLQTRDRLANWSRQEPIFSECNNYCPPIQRQGCVEASRQLLSQTINNGNRELIRLGYQNRLIENPNNTHGLLIENGDLHLSELFFIMDKTGLNIENLPTIERVTKMLFQLRDDIPWLKSINVEQTSNGYRLVPEQKLSTSDRDLLLGGLWKKTRSRAFEVIDP